MKRKKKAFTKKDFVGCRALLDAGVKQKVIADVTGWSRSVIYQVSRATTFDEYLSINEERFNKKETTKPEQFDGTNTIVSVLKAMEYNQQQMVVALESIVDHFNKLT